MKVLITSDSHDRWDHLTTAVEKGNEAGCEVMLFAGDFISPPGLSILGMFKGDVHFIWGNNEGEKVGLTRKIDAMENVTLHGDVFEEEMGGLKFYMNHYPEIVRNAAESGKYDVCVYGHDHTYHEETLENNTVLLNPGEVQGFASGTPTCMVFDTATKEVTKIELA